MKKKDIFYPIRRLHGYIHEAGQRYKRNILMALYLVYPFGKKVLIPGTPEHRNLGDSTIVTAEKYFLEKCGIPIDRIKEITFSEYQQYHKLLIKIVRGNFLIAQLGGGNMGDQWLAEEKLHRNILVDFPRNAVVIFPQTIYYTNTIKGNEEKEKSVSIYNRKKNLTLVAREKKSYEIMNNIYPDIQILLTPDIVLSSTKEIYGVVPQERKNILLCWRTDAEQVLTQYDHHVIELYMQKCNYPYKVTDMYSDCPVNKENRNKCVCRKMNEFASARLVITDRLHGMVFSAITGTPCIVFGNYNHKVEGTYEWIKYLSYIRFVKSVEEMEEVFAELIVMEDCEYDNSPLVPYFEKLEEVVKNYAVS